MFIESDSPRSFLRQEFEHRLKRNPRYSLRAFARQLGLHPARLSYVLSGKHGLSRHAAALLADRLGLSAEERSYFLELADACHARSPMKREAARERLAVLKIPTHQQLQLDAFAAVSEWFYFTILELTSVADFNRDSHWIASRLGITVTQAKLAIERLLRLELLEETPDGILRATERFTFSPARMPSEILRASQHQLLAKAADALETQAFHERDCAAMILAVDPQDLPAAMETLKAFRRDFARQYGAPQKTKRSVYALTTQLFRLTTESIPPPSNPKKVNL